MFFKMLKSDLKQKKGLNVVLFLFITVASILVFVSSVQTYQFFTGNSRNKEVCKISDLLLFHSNEGSQQELGREKVEDVLNKNSHVKDFYRKEMIQVNSKLIEIDRFENTEINDWKYYENYIITLPKDKDLVFDLNDNPFYVANGTVYLAEDLRTITGASVGDKIRFTTSLGNVYELQIAGFYKHPYLGSFRWYIVSDADYQVLSSEYFTSYDLYGVNLDEVSYYISEELIQPLVYEMPIYTAVQDFSSSNDYILGYILAIFLTLVSVFLILIIVMTIRFTMISALKEEEREIGMMRAVGVDSFSFRWLFAAKYIAFAVIGGIIGIIAGFPLSKTVLLMFGADSIQPDNGSVIFIGVLSVLFIVALMLGFSMLVMRHINKISVMQAIHGRDNGESFGNSSVIYLHKRKKLPVPLYLAVSDILKRFRRYIFLFIAYTLGVLMILVVVNVKNTVINPDYLKYTMNYRMDFSLNLEWETFMSYANRARADGKGVWSYINEDIANAGIPAYVDDEHYNVYGMLLYGDKLELNVDIIYGKGDISQLSYREGGKVPKLANEAAMSYYTASRLGLNIGDTITLSVPHDSDDGLTSTYKKEEFILTAYLNVMEGGSPKIVLGSDYENPSRNTYWMAMIINAQGREKDKALADLKELFGEEHVQSGMEYTKMVLFEYDQLFTLLEYVVTISVILILMLMTYLYTSIFIAEEKSEIALLKSIGFADKAIKWSHIFRILILSAVSVVIGEILLRTVGQVIVEKVMETMELTGFRFLPEYMMSLIVVPIIVIGAVLITQWLNLKNVEKIAVWNIKDE